MFAGTLASILGLFGLLSDRHTTRLIADIHTSTQSTLTDMRKGFSESHERLGAILERMDQRLERVEQQPDRLAQILERMDRGAEERYRDLRGRIEGEA
jgi:hypothetical protein